MFKIGDEMAGKFNLVGNEKAIFSSTLLNTYKDMEDMLLELGREIKDLGFDEDIRDMQYRIWEQEKAEDLLTSVNESFALCDSVSARINEKLDVLDNLIIKGEIKEQQELIAQIVAIYDKLYDILTFVINVAHENRSQIVGTNFVTKSLFKHDAKHLDLNIDTDKIGDSSRTRKRTYMRWIQEVKKCMDSIQEILDGSSAELALPPESTL